MERSLKRSDEKGRAQEVAPIQLPACQGTASAPTPLWDGASVSTFRVQSTSPKPPWRSCLAKPPRSPYNGQSTPDARRRIPERPPRPPPESPSPTRAPPRPPAPAARQRAAGAGGHRPSAGSARGRRGAQTPRWPGRLIASRRRGSNNVESRAGVGT